MLFLRRRTFVINRHLQFGILLTSLSHVGFLVLVVSLALFTPLVLELRHPDFASARSYEAALRILYLHETYWLPVLLSLLVIAYHSVSTSRRIAGPIYRFRCVCDAMKAGVVPRPLRLRKGDYFPHERDAVNDMLDAWRDRLAQMQQESCALHASLTKYGALRTATHTDEVAEAVWTDIVRAEHQLRDTVFRVTCETEAGGPRASPAS